MSATALRSDGETPSVIASLMPIMAAVFIAFLMIGLALPVLPLHVHSDLGLGGFAVGIVAGSQFTASLVSRIWAGGYADGRGAKRAVVIGLLAASASGLIYLASLPFTYDPILSATILVIGRGVLGETHMRPNLALGARRSRHSAEAC